MCLSLVACDRGRADVLQEFPPPRLAREKGSSPLTAVSVQTDCKATWRLFGRKSRETYQLLGRGSFEVRGEPPQLVAGIVAFDPAESKPDLPPDVERALHTRGEMVPWVWRVLSVDQPATDYEGLSPSNPSGNGQSGLSEVEFNGVRTRQTHDISVKLTPADGEPGDLTFDTQLRLDLAAHRVRGIVLADDSPPRRTDLVIQCRLSAAGDGE
jgi:hypothetical protein